MFCIAGADGFFGAYLTKMLLASGEEVLALYHRAPVFPDGEKLTNLPFELTDGSRTDALCERLKKYPDVKLVYLIACHDPDKVKSDPAFASFVNHDCYERFLSSVHNAGVRRLFYASSDTVYGENPGGVPFTEASVPSPVNLYGEHKRKAEELTLAYGYSAARFPYMYAPSLCGKKHFFDSLTMKLRNGEKIEMFSDYVRSSVTYPTAAELLYRLMNTETEERIFNICADEPTSKYDIGLTAARLCGADTSLVVPVSMDGAGVFTERRAKTVIMSNALLKSVLGLRTAIPSDEGLTN